MDLCACLTITPDLSGVSEPIPYLQVFSDRVRVGALVDNGSGIKKCTIEGYLCDVEKIFASVGSKDPHLDILGRIDFQLSSQLCAYARSDPPPERIFPVPIALLNEC